MAYKELQIRRDTAATWASNNPTLKSGEFGFESDTGKVKLGDGSTAWAGLDYINPQDLSTTASPQYAGLSIVGGATGASFTRSGSSGVCVLSVANNTDTIYFGINANEDFGIGPNLDIGSGPFLTIDHTNSFTGINEANPAFPLEMSFAGPQFVLHSTTREDTDGGRGSSFMGRGEQSGGEESTLALVKFSHDGTGDDEKGRIDFYINSGAASVNQFRVASDGGTYMYNLKSGATQVAAGAAANELWVTSSHASLPDNVVMIGV